MSGESVREKIAAQIKADNPRYVVNAFAASVPEALAAGKVHVAVWRTDLRQAQGHLTHVLRIEVITAGAGSLKAEDAADIALDQVLLSLQRLDEVGFISAEQAIFNERFTGYAISAEVQSSDVYKSLIFEERSI